MSPDPEERWLRELMYELRQEDTAGAPSFEAMWDAAGEEARLDTGRGRDRRDRGRRQRRQQRQRRPTMSRVLQLATAAAVVVAVGTLTVIDRHRNPHHDEIAMVMVSTWESPTAALLPVSHAGQHRRASSWSSPTASLLHSSATSLEPLPTIGHPGSGSRVNPRFN